VEVPSVEVSVEMPSVEVPSVEASVEVPSVDAPLVEVPSVDVAVDVSAADDVGGDGDVKNHAVVQLIAVCDRSR